MKRVYVKTFHSVVLALAIGAASISSAIAHDSFNFGINIGGYGFAPPPVVYYPHPSYYHEPIVYYRHAPAVIYSQPFVSFSNFNQPRFGGWHHQDNRRWNRGWDRGGRNHWDRGGRGHWERGGRNRGGRNHRDDD